MKRPAFRFKILVNRKDMLGQGLSLIKTFIRSSLDNYVLPGTLTGTEILLLYMSQWKRDVVLFTTLTRHLIRPPDETPEYVETAGDSENEAVSPK